MKIKDILKSKSKELVNIASENTTKLFDYPKIKSKQLKDMINLKIREKAIIATKARLIENSKNNGNGYVGGNPFNDQLGFAKLVQSGSDTILNMIEMEKEQVIHLQIY